MPKNERYEILLKLADVQQMLTSKLINKQNQNKTNEKQQKQQGQKQKREIVNNTQPISNIYVNMILDVCILSFLYTNTYMYWASQALIIRHNNGQFTVPYTGETFSS